MSDTVRRCVGQILTLLSHNYPVDLTGYDTFGGQDILLLHRCPEDIMRLIGIHDRLQEELKLVQAQEDATDLHSVERVKLAIQAHLLDCRIDAILALVELALAEAVSSKLTEISVNGQNYGIYLRQTGEIVASPEGAAENGEVLFEADRLEDGAAPVYVDTTVQQA